MRWREWRLELLLTLGLLAYNVLFLGWFGLTDVDEAIFAEATREMIVTGDYITPHYNGGVRWDKPPLTYWLMSGPMRVLGATAVGARAWSAICGALCGLMLMLFGRHVFDRRTGLCSAAVMGFCLHGFALSHMSITDMTLATFMAAGWLALYLASETGSAAWFAAAGLGLGLATLTKGPVALVLPGVSWFLWLAWSRRLRILADRRFWLGPAVWLLIVAPWCVAIYSLHGDAFFASFLGYHNVDRFARTQSGHGGPVWMYPAVMTVGLLPWSGFALAGLADAWRRRGDGAAGRALMLLLLGVVCTVGLFSVSGTKLINYIAPAYPLVALLAGRIAAEASSRPADARPWAVWWQLNLLGVVAVGLALVGIRAILSLPGLAAGLRSQLGVALDPGSGPALGGVAMILAAVPPVTMWWRGRHRDGVIGLAAAGAILGWAAWLGAGPVVYHYQQGALRVLGVVAASRAATSDELATLNVHVPSLAFNTRRLFTRYTFEKRDPAGAADLAARFAERRPIYLITRAERQGDLVPSRFCYSWGERYGWRLYSNRRPPAGWILPPPPWREAEARMLEMVP